MLIVQVLFELFKNSFHDDGRKAGLKLFSCLLVVADIKTMISAFFLQTPKNCLKFLFLSQCKIYFPQ